jgi:hypothetical protein
MKPTILAASLLGLPRATIALSIVAATATAGHALPDDHLQCFQVTDATSQRRLKGLLDLVTPPSILSDGCRISRARFYCVPASKTVESGTIFNGRDPVALVPHVGPPAEGPRICYNVQCDRPAGFVPLAEVTDQFGHRNLTKRPSGMVCTPARIGGTYCGNGTRDAGEDCEGGDLGGATCQTVGFPAGSLGCTAWCAYDTSECSASGGTLPATGQTSCWDSSGVAIDCAGTGHDGELQAGATLAYVDHGDGTITDLNTGLMWEKLSDDGSIHDWDTAYTWPDSFGKATALNGASFAGYTDWRIPNVKELVSITNYQFQDPSLSPVFHTGCTPGCTVATCSCTKSPQVTGYYWSSTTHVPNPVQAWGVSAHGGLVIQNVKEPFATLYVRAVRGASSSFPRTGQTTCWDAGGAVIPCVGTGHDGETRAGRSLAYVDNDDGTITDVRTGLVWEKLSNDATIHDRDDFYDWDDAFAVKVAALNTGSFAGHTDWRLPNVKELQSLLNYENGNPTISGAFNTSCPVGCDVTTCSCTLPTHIYWSSSTAVGNPQSAWIVSAVNGRVEPSPKTEIYTVRAVRGGS